jgi:hypothetical protein
LVRTQDSANRLTQLTLFLLEFLACLAMHASSRSRRSSGILSNAACWLPSRQVARETVDQIRGQRRTAPFARCESGEAARRAAAEAERSARCLFSDR